MLVMGDISEKHRKNLCKHTIRCGTPGAPRIGLCPSFRREMLMGQSCFGGDMTAYMWGIVTVIYPSRDAPIRTAYAIALCAVR